MQDSHDGYDIIRVKEGSQPIIVLPILSFLFLHILAYANSAAACTDLPVRIAGQNSICYSSLQQAYNAASDGAILQSKSTVLIENFNANRNISVTLQGGYNPDYSAVTGLTYLRGIITTSAGTLMAGNLQTSVAPDVTITSPSTGLTNNRTPLLMFGASDGAVQVYVDNRIVSKVAGNNLDPLPDGLHTVRVVSTDSGSTVGSASISFTVDTTAPSGRIIINNGARYTNGILVTLTLSATDLNGVSQMKFSNNGQTWYGPVDYATTRLYALSMGDGAKTVYVMFKDNAGNWSPPYSNTIIVDSTGTLDPDVFNAYCIGTDKYIVGPSTFTSGMTIPVAGTSGILIHSPVDGSTVDGPKVIIKGAIDTTIPVNKVIVRVSSSPTDTGTNYSAHVNGNYFAAKLSLATGLTNTITAISYDKNGGQHQASIAVYANVQSNNVNLSATPDTGIPTPQQNGQSGFDVSLASQVSLVSPVTSYTWDFNGSGSNQVQCFTHSNVMAEYQQPGLYLTFVTVTDAAGDMYSDTQIVNVLDAAQMTAILQPIWSDTKTALANGNIPAALNNFSDNAKAGYQANFELLRNFLPQIAQDMGDNITLKRMDDNSAEMELLRTENGVQRSYYIEFTRAADGSWKLNFF